MPDHTPSFDEMPLYDVPAAPASVREAASRRRLRSRFLRAGRAAVDDRELLELLLSGHAGTADAGALAASLLEIFGTGPRALAAPPDRLRALPGLSENAIAAIKAAEALGIGMAREEIPATVRPSFDNYDKVIEYCRSLAGQREVEEFHNLYLDRKNRLVADEMQQRGTVCHTPVFRHRRCLIPADGFYEWQRRGGIKQPWLFGLRDGTPFTFAGLWEQWRVPEGAALTGSLAERSPGDSVETCTILTTAANDTVAPVHGRMPVILPRDAWDAWLAGEDVSLAPYPADDMTAHPVSTLVNRAANEDPRCVEPIALT